MNECNDACEYDALVAARALVRVGKNEQAASAFVTILRRHDYAPYIRTHDDIDPWNEILDLPIGVRANLPQDLCDAFTNDNWHRQRIQGPDWSRK